MYSINQNINDYDLTHKKIGFKAGVTQSNIMPNALNMQQTREPELPNMYYMPEKYQKPKTFKEKLKKVDMLGIIYQWFEHPLLMLGTCTGISLGIDAFEKSCNKEYDKSIIGKATKFGDKIENSRVIQNDGSQKVLNGIKKGWNAVKNFALKNSVISAMFKTPSQPEMSMPKDEVKNLNFRIVTKFKEFVGRLDLMPNETEGAEKLVENIGNTKQLTLKSLAVDPKELEYLKKTYNNKLSSVEEEELVNRINLKRIGKSESDIASIVKQKNARELVKQEIINKMGLTKEELEMIMKDEYGVHLDKVIKASKNLSGLKINNFPMGMLKTPGLKQPLANTLSANGIYNMGYSITEGAKTNTGKGMSKFLQMLHRGFTFGGTKFGVMLFVAPLLVETMINTKKADKKEKIGTAVEGTINTVSWVFTFPLILKAIHAYGGIQYAGMGEEKVAKYRELVNKFNEKAIAGKFKDRAEYNEAKRKLKKRLRDLRRVENQTFLTKMFRGASHFTKADLLSIESYRGKNGFMNFVRRLPDIVVNKFGYSAARFIVFMLVGMPLVDKLIKKCTNKIFGKSYDGMKEEEIKDAKERQEEFTMNDLRARMLEAQKNKMNPQPKAESIVTDLPEFPNPAIRMIENRVDNTAEINSTNKPVDENNVDKEASGNNLDINTESEKSEENAVNFVTPKTNEEVTPAQNKKITDDYTYIPSSINTLNNIDPQSQINKYIPSQTGVKLNKSFDNSALESAIKRAERAEKRAISTLAGNFGSAE
ncbi:MAG: hypothetical protein MJ230_05000 [bacterium]|nr:hypothetical protein [bacterium]